MPDKKYVDVKLVKEALLGWDEDPSDEDLEYAIDNIPTADVVEVKQIEIIRDDLKWWLTTNSEKGVVYIPEFVVENMIAKMTRTPKERGKEK